MLPWAPGFANPHGKCFHAVQKVQTEQDEAVWICSLHELSFSRTGLCVHLGAPEQGRLIEQGLIHELSSFTYPTAEAGAGRSESDTETELRARNICSVGWQEKETQVTEGS